MKKSILLILCLALIPLLNSCGTIYGAAVDERNVRTIASDNKIKANILKAYSDDDLVGLLDFSVSSYESHVYLIGEYKTVAQKKGPLNLQKIWLA